VAGLTASAAGLGALYNVLINLQQIDDAGFSRDMLAEALALNDKIENVVGQVKALVKEALLR
jgi:formiminotetrahydrofolate cyclodeaminase